MDNTYDLYTDVSVERSEVTKAREVLRTKHKIVVRNYAIDVNDNGSVFIKVMGMDTDDIDDLLCAFADIHASGEVRMEVLDIIYYRGKELPKIRNEKYILTNGQIRKNGRLYHPTVCDVKKE